MNQHPLLLLALAVAAAPAFAEKPADAPTPETDLHRQIEAVGATIPAFKVLPLTPNGPAAKPVEDVIVRPVLKKDKGPTEIDALDATFDQKANEAVFIGEVVVKDPEFNVKCDKLTAHLKPAEKPGTVPETPAGKPPKGATPAPAAAKKKSGGGLRKAVAEANPGNRVTIMQDKTDPDGTVQHSVGQADRATYDAVTGDIVLTGKPEIQQGINLVIATAQSTKMTLNRDGHMHAEGPHKTIIVDKGDTGL